MTRLAQLALVLLLCSAFVQPGAALQHCNSSICHYWGSCEAGVNSTFHCNCYIPRFEENGAPSQSVAHGTCRSGAFAYRARSGLATFTRTAVVLTHFAVVLLCVRSAWHASCAVGVNLQTSGLTLLLLGSLCNTLFYSVDPMGTSDIFPPTVTRFFMNFPLAAEACAFIHVLFFFRSVTSPVAIARLGIRTPHPAAAAAERASMPLTSHLTVQRALTTRTTQRRSAPPRSSVTSDVKYKLTILVTCMMMLLVTISAALLQIQVLFVVFFALVALSTSILLAVLGDRLRPLCCASRAFLTARYEKPSVAEAHARADAKAKAAQEQAAAELAAEQRLADEELDQARVFAGTLKQAAAAAAAASATPGSGLTAPPWVGPLRSGSRRTLAVAGPGGARLSPRPSLQRIPSQLGAGIAGGGGSGGAPPAVSLSSPSVEDMSGRRSVIQLGGPPTPVNGSAPLSAMQPLPEQQQQQLAGPTVIVHADPSTAAASGTHGGSSVAMTVSQSSHSNLHSLAAMGGGATDSRGQSPDRLERSDRLLQVHHIPGGGGDRLITMAAMATPPSSNVHIPSDRERLLPLRGGSQSQLQLLPQGSFSSLPAVGGAGGSAADKISRRGSSRNPSALRLLQKRESKLAGLAAAAGAAGAGGAGGGDLSPPPAVDGKRELAARTSFTERQSPPMRSRGMSAASAEQRLVVHLDPLALSSAGAGIGTGADSAAAGAPALPPVAAPPVLPPLHPGRGLSSRALGAAPLPPLHLPAGPPAAAGAADVAASGAGTGDSSPVATLGAASGTPVLAPAAAAAAAGTAGGSPAAAGQPIAQGAAPLPAALALPLTASGSAQPLLPAGSAPSDAAAAAGPPPLVPSLTLPKLRPAENRPLQKKGSKHGKHGRGGSLHGQGQSQGKLRRKSSRSLRRTQSNVLNQITHARYEVRRLVRCAALSIGLALLLSALEGYWSVVAESTSADAFISLALGANLVRALWCYSLIFILWPGRRSAEPDPLGTVSPDLIEITPGESGSVSFDVDA